MIGATQGNLARLAAELRTIGGGSRGINATVKALEGLGKVRMGAGLLGDMDKVMLASRELATVQAAMARSAAETAIAYREMARTAPRPTSGGRAPPAGGPGPAGRAAPQGMSHGDLLNTAMGLQMGGEAGMGIFGRAIKAEMDVSQQLASLRFNTTVTDAQVGEVRALAERMTRQTPGTTAVENIKTIVEAYVAVGDLNEAMAGAPAMAQMAYVLKNMPGAHHGDSAFAGAQAIEVMQRFYDPKTHQVSMEAFNQQLAAMQQVAVGTRGRVPPEAYLAFAKQSRVGGMVADDQFLYRDLPGMLISLGGSRAGTGDAATFQQFITGRMTEHAASRLQAAGILDKGAQWSGGMVADMQKHMPGYDVFGHNPAEWVRQFMLDPKSGALARNKIDPNDKLAVAKFLSDWSSRQTGLGFMAEMTLGMGGIVKEGTKVAQTTTNPMQVMQQQDPMQKVREFHAAENELMLTLGKDAMGPALEALKGLTQVIRELAEWGKSHPNAAKDLTLVGGGLSILATGAGELAMVLFLGAPLLKGMGGLARALLPFAPGASAEVALATLAGAGVGSLAALGLAAMALPVALSTAAQALGIVNTQGAGGGGKGLQPHGFIPGPPANGGTGNQFGDAIQDWWKRFSTTPSYAPHGRDLRHPSSYLAPAEPPAQMQPIVFHLDGRKVAEGVIPYIGRAVDGPQHGATSFDGRMSPRYGGASMAI